MFGPNSIKIILNNRLSSRGYNNFNNLVLPGPCCVQNLIRSPIYKNCFSVFWAVSSAFDFKVSKSAKKDPKHFFVKRFSTGIKKHRFSCLFWIRWKSWKQFHMKKLSKNVSEIYTFFTFPHVNQIYFLIHFSVWIFGNFSTNLKSAWNSVFLIPILNLFTLYTYIEYLKKEFWGPYCHFLLTLKLNAVEMAQKMKNIFVMCLRIKFCNNQWPGSRVRRNHNFFYLLWSKFKWIWILFASYSIWCKNTCCS